MAQRRKPYDLLMLMSVEFLMAVLIFYTGALMLLMTYGASVDSIRESLGSGVAPMLYDDPKGVLEMLGWTFAALTIAILAELWGLFKGKKYAYLFGMVTAFVIAIVNVITLMIFGFDNFQNMIRLVLGAVLPLVAIYYLVRPSIKAYLMVK